MRARHHATLVVPRRLRLATHRGGLRRRRTLHAVHHPRVKRIAARRRATSAMRGVTTGATTAARHRAKPRAVRHRRIIATAGRRRPAIIAMCGASRVTTGVLRLRVKLRVMPRRRATTEARLRRIIATPAVTMHAMIAVRRRAKPHAADLRRAITVARRPAVMAVAILRIVAPCCANMSAMPAVSSRSSGNLAAARRRGFRRPRGIATPIIAGSSALREARDRLDHLVVEAVEAVGGASLTRIAGVDAAV